MSHLIKVLTIFIVIFSFNIFAVEHSLESMTFKNPNQPFDNIITGGQPSLGDMDNLKKIGVTNIINLRAANEFDVFNESTESAKRGINYFSLEISGADGITVDNAVQLDKLLELVKGTTFLHCASSNRVGALLAIREVVINGKSKEEALAIGESAGLSSLYETTENLLDNLMSK